MPPERRKSGRLSGKASDTPLTPYSPRRSARLSAAQPSTINESSDLDTKPSRINESSPLATNTPTLAAEDDAAPQLHTPGKLRKPTRRRPAAATDFPDDMLEDPSGGFDSPSPAARAADQTAKYGKQARHLRERIWELAEREKETKSEEEQAAQWATERSGDQTKVEPGALSGEGRPRAGENPEVKEEPAEPSARLLGSSSVAGSGSRKAPVSPPSPYSPRKSSRVSATQSPQINESSPFATDNSANTADADDDAPQNCTPGKLRKPTRGAAGATDTPDDQQEMIGDYPAGSHAFDNEADYGTHGRRWEHLRERKGQPVERATSEELEEAARAKVGGSKGHKERKRGALAGEKRPTGGGEEEVEDEPAEGDEWEVEEFPKGGGRGSR